MAPPANSRAATPVGKRCWRGAIWDTSSQRERRGREIHYRLVDGLPELLAAADRVLERTGERVMACPRYGALAARRAAA